MVSTRNENDFAVLIMFDSHTFCFCGKPDARDGGKNTVQHMTDLLFL